MTQNEAGVETGRAGRTRGRPFHRPGRALKSKMRSVAAKKGFAEPDVLLRWSEAVGPALAGICTPVKVTFGDAIGATLVVHTNSARAPEVEHRGPQIVEAINRFYGYRAITRMRITQSTRRPGLNVGFAEPATPFEHGTQPQSEPGEDEKRRARALTEGIGDHDLRKALTQMGAWVLSRPRSDDQTRSNGDD
ncbi:MAG: DUF721 domain-containing protein [Pseudomonadota bacterium]